MTLIVMLFHTLFTYPILNALLLLYAWLGDFSLAIVALTIGISLLLLPISLRQLRQARMTRKLQPEIQALRERYSADRVAQAQALRQLYQANGIRTSSTILSLLLQAPIYSGLYFALNMILQAASVADLNNILYPFVTHLTSLPNLNLMWLTLLNASWHISLGVPDPTPILPLLTGLLTFIQARIAQPVSMVEARENIQQISHSIQWVLMLIPVAITIVITWRFAAGLALYRVVSLLLNIAQQYIAAIWREPELKMTSIENRSTSIERGTPYREVRSSLRLRHNKRQKTSRSQRRRK